MSDAERKREQALERYAQGLWPSPGSFRFFTGDSCYCCGGAVFVSPITRTLFACPRCHPYWPEAAHLCRDPAPLPMPDE